MPSSYKLKYIRDLFSNIFESNSQKTMFENNF